MLSNSLEGRLGAGSLRATSPFVPFSGRGPYGPSDATLRESPNRERQPVRRLRLPQEPSRGIVQESAVAQMAGNPAITGGRPKGL